jgi:MFS superfamily sulfate permease-like transporter
VDTHRCCACRGLRSDAAGAICAVVGATLAAVPKAQAEASLLTLAFMTAGWLMVAGALRVTFLQRLFPEPARVGVLTGSGVAVAVTQSAELALTGPRSLAMGVGSIVLLLMLRRLGLRASAVLLLLELTTAASAALDLERRGIRVLGSSSVALAATPRFAPLEGRTLVLLTTAGLSIAVLASACPLAAAEPCTSSVASGERAKMRLAAVLAGALLALALALSNVLGQLPLAAISAVLVVVSLGWIDARRLSELRQRSPRHFRIALAAAFGVTIFGLPWGGTIGVVAALGDMFCHAMTREVSSSGADEQQRRGSVARSLPVGEGRRAYRRRRGAYRWARATWLPHRRRARRSGASRDEAAAAGNRSRPSG